VGRDGCLAFKYETDLPTRNVSYTFELFIFKINKVVTRRFRVRFIYIARIVYIIARKYRRWQCVCVVHSISAINEQRTENNVFRITTVIAVIPGACSE